MLLSSSKRKPTQLWLESITAEKVRFVKPVTTRDIFDGMSKNFHPDGLFSTEIFGIAGDPARDMNASYIEYGVKIFKPKIFGELMALKGLYLSILTGAKTAVFDTAEKDFKESTAPEAGSGYAFFCKYVEKIEFKKNKSPARNSRVSLLEKERGKWFEERCYVIPAGLRDLEMDADGRATKHEINDLYAKLIGTASGVVATTDMGTAAYDGVRLLLTRARREIYDMIFEIIGGKSGYINGKFASRAVVYGSRNVLSVIDPSIDDLDQDNVPGPESVVMGLHQVIKNMTPLTIFHVRDRFLNGIFSSAEGPARLVNAKTLKPEYVDVSPATRDLWTTRDGLVGIMNKFADNEVRHRPIMVEGRYLGLVYRGKDMTFKAFDNIEDLPDGFDPKCVGPMTYAEFFYISGYKIFNEFYTEIVRYPISGTDSTVPCKIYVKTTVQGNVRVELDENWQPTTGVKALEYPRLDIKTFVSTQSPHSIRLKGYNADFDGDMGSATTLFSREATEEIRRYLGTRAAWVRPDGSARASVVFDTLKLVVHNLTREEHDYERLAA